MTNNMKIKESQTRYCWRDFEIKPTMFIDGHIDPCKFDLVRWYAHTHIESYNPLNKTTELIDCSCYSIASLNWCKSSGRFSFESYDMRFIDDYEEGLVQFIKEFTTSKEKEFIESGVSLNEYT